MILILDLGFILTLVDDVCNEFNLLCSFELLQLVEFIDNELCQFRHRRQLCSSSTDIIPSFAKNIRVDSLTITYQAELALLSVDEIKVV